MTASVTTNPLADAPFRQMADDLAWIIDCLKNPESVESVESVVLRAYSLKLQLMLLDKAARP